MDNITHSLTGALAAKLIEGGRFPAKDQKGQERVLFWLLVLSVNLPDIDVPLTLLIDPIFSIKYHR